ncbi:CIS tube protein [Paenibacillus hexagrammi]|uniref:CIS tube protein n=1 Tax=Paenibacillus hexagrammi TaxID=2908839 RepID=UPI003313022C
MALKKAMIIVDKGNSKENLEVLFNPSEYSLDTSNSYSWNTVPGMSMPIGQFISGGTTSLTMDFFFDTYEKGTDVRDYTRKISGLLDVESELHAPPICRFVWGSLDFQGVVEKVTQSFTMFLDSGIPVRAKLKVTFRSWHNKKSSCRRFPGILPIVRSRRCSSRANSSGCWRLRNMKTRECGAKLRRPIKLIIR